jgi:hypothetical protein
MNRLLKATAMAGLVVTSAAGSAFAQDEQPAFPPMRPVETWTCDLVDGKEPGDLEKVNAEWIEWMDEQGGKDYVALFVTPYFFDNPGFDVGWIVVYDNGRSFGASSDQWMTASGALGEKFDEFITCSGHAGWGSILVNTPEADSDPEDKRFVLSITDCALAEDRELPDYFAAMLEWDSYSKANGINETGWLWFPMVGESHDDYDFKLVMSQHDYTTMGENWQKVVDGHWVRHNELFGNVADCEVPRVYNAKMLRNWANR